jgi:hypothetical protein
LPLIPSIGYAIGLNDEAGVASASSLSNPVSCNWACFEIRLVVFLEPIKSLMCAFEVPASDSKKTGHGVDGERENHGIEAER